MIPSHILDKPLIGHYFITLRNIVVQNTQPTLDGITSLFERVGEPPRGQYEKFSVLNHYKFEPLNFSHLVYIPTLLLASTDYLHDNAPSKGPTYTRVEISPDENIGLQDHSTMLVCEYTSGGISPHENKTIHPTMFDCDLNKRSNRPIQPLKRAAIFSLMTI